MTKNLYALLISFVIILVILVAVLVSPAFAGYLGALLGQDLHKDGITLFVTLTQFPVFSALVLQFNLRLEKIVSLLNRNQLTIMFQQISQNLQVWAAAGIGTIILGFGLGIFEIKALLFLSAYYVVVSAGIIGIILFNVCAHLGKIGEMSPTDRKFLSWFKMLWWGYMPDKKSLPGTDV